MKFRKKPVVIEAEVYRDGLEDGFVDGYYDYLGKVYTVKDYPDKWWEEVSCKTIKIPYINTLEGKHYISPGDWIITGINGERYPCKPDIFEKTYEAIKEG